ncbi:MAG: hypothetical protein KGY81_09690, partial [Phycisphaerae bacterium]|nr:hypothetical protein [Phycisphaerae bacterium]
RAGRRVFPVVRDRSSSWQRLGPEKTNAGPTRRPANRHYNAGSWIGQVFSIGTHGGQVFPFGLLSRLVYPLRLGMHGLAAGSRLRFSRGAGT